MGSVINNAGADPMVFLTNGSRIALQLEGPSDRPQSIVQAAQESYYALHGVWPYVDGMPNQLPVPPEPIVKNIGNVKATGDDVNEAGDNITFNEGAESTVTAEIDGGATNATYKWTVRSGNEYVSISGSSDLKTVTLSGDAGGTGTVRCTVSSITASDSPQQATLSVTVAAPSGPNSAKKSRAKK